MARGQYRLTAAVEDLRALVRYAELSRAGSWSAALNIAGRDRLGGDVVARFKRQTPTEVEELRLELRAFLRALAGGSWAMPPSFKPTLTLLREASRTRLLVTNGEPRDVTLYLAAAIAQEAGVDRLRCCPAPDCGKVFVKIGRREFCSFTCQRRVYIKNYDPFAAKPMRSRARGKERQQHHGRKTTRTRGR